MTVEPGTRDSDRRRAAGEAAPRRAGLRSRWRPIRNRIRALARRHYIIFYAVSIALTVAGLHLAQDLILDQLRRVAA
jgi:hypothetical protein